MDGGDFFRLLPCPDHADNPVRTAGVQGKKTKAGSRSGWKSDCFAELDNTLPQGCPIGNAMKRAWGQAPWDWRAGWLPGTHSSVSAGARECHRTRWPAGPLAHWPPGPL